MAVVPAFSGELTSRSLCCRLPIGRYNMQVRSSREAEGEKDSQAANYFSLPFHSMNGA